MPEGHTIHRLAMDHAKLLKGQTIRASSPQGRFEAGAAFIDGARFESAEAWGKHLFHRYEGDRWLHVHLGLIGKFWTFTGDPPATHRQVRLRVAVPAGGFDLTGPMVCRIVEPAERKAVIASLGPDPLRKDADPELGWKALRRRKGPVGVALMDQKVVAGVGNVFRAEALFVHGMHPERPANSLTHEEWLALWETLVSMLRQGVKDRRIVTVDPVELGKPRRRITRAEATYAYKRERCLRCGGPIRRWDLAGRWAYACEHCQR